MHLEWCRCVGCANVQRLRDVRLSSPDFGHDLYVRTKRNDAAVGRWNVAAVGDGGVVVVVVRDVEEQMALVIVVLQSDRRT